MEELLGHYAGVLLDAYGVLVDARGALPGAVELIAELTARGIPYAVVTNDASRSRDDLRDAVRELRNERSVRAHRDLGQLVARVLPRARPRGRAHRGARHR